MGVVSKRRGSFTFSGNSQHRFVFYIKCLCIISGLILFFFSQGQVPNKIFLYYKKRFNCPFQIKIYFYLWDC